MEARLGEKIGRLCGAFAGNRKVARANGNPASERERGCGQLKNTISEMQLCGYGIKSDDGQFFRFLLSARSP